MGFIRFFLTAFFNQNAERLNLRLPLRDPLLIPVVSFFFYP
jgi:hypothetical protein